MQSQKIIALASAARTVSGSSVLGELPDNYVELNAYVSVTAATAATGLPSLTVTYQCSSDGVTYYDHTSGAAITAIGNQLIKVPSNIGRFGRISYVISGDTPSLTFSVVAEAKRN